MLGFTIYPKIQAILLTIERTYPVWNLQHLLLMGRLRGGFSARQWMYCSHWRASAQIGGQNLLTSDVIYQIVVDVLRAMAEGILPVLALTGTLQLWHLVVVAVILRPGAL